MTHSNEQMIPINSILPDTCINNDIEKYLNLDKIIKTIGPYGSIVLHIANIHYGDNEVVQLLLTNNARKSLEHISYRLTFQDESRMNEIKKLMQKNLNLFSREKNEDVDDYIEWSLIGTDLKKNRQEFREQIDLYKTYDNQHHFISKLLLEIIEYYLNEYLIHEEHFPKEQTAKLKFCFQKAIDEQSYFKYFIKAYTSTNNFHRILNKHLALYILDYFDTSSYSSSPTNYRLINCLVHIITLLINHPDTYKYTYRGMTYRGLLMTKKDLEHYNIGNHILNKSFVSTSKNRSVAQAFSANDQQTSEKVSVLLKYTTKQNQTAIDIEHLSSLEDEQEVLILPFSVFQIKNRIDNNPQMSPPVLVEIDLEECEDNEQINNGKPLTNLRYQTKKRKNVLKSKCLYISIGLLIISSLILGAVKYIQKPINEEENISKDNCPTIINRPNWNAAEPKQKVVLSTPVSYVGIYHTTGAQCKTRDACKSTVQYWQKVHMINKTWDDIGYNFLVGGNDGYVFEGRGWNYSGSHCRTFNNKSIGIGVIGDFTSIKPSNSLTNAVHKLINCGISIGFIRKDYKFLGHWGFGIIESYILNLNKSLHKIQYCPPPLTTVAPK